MKRLFTVAVAAACVMAVSCNPETVPAHSAENGEIVFTAGGAMSANVTTKTSLVLNLEATGFYACATTGSGTETLLWDNGVFIYNGSKYAGGKYWPLTNNGIHFYAANSSVTFSEGRCYVNGVSANSKDVVCATLASPVWGQENELEFNHIFARIGNVGVTAPAGYNVNSFSLTITPYVSGNYNITDNSWSSLGTDTNTPTKTIATSASPTNENDVWIVPGTYELTASYTLKKGSGNGSYTESFNETASVTLLAGSVNNIQATLPDGNATDIAFTVSVTPWGSNTVNATF